MKKKSFLSAVALSVFIAQSFAQSVNKGDPSVDWEGIYGHEPYRFYNGVAWAQKKGDEYWGVVDTHGKEITPFKYGSPNYEDSDASDGMISFKLDGKYGYMDMTGKEVIAPQFYYARQFHTGLAPVVNGNKWGVIRKDGSYLIEPKYGDIGLFEYRTAYVSNGDRDGDDYQIGIVDANGDLIVPMIYKAVKPVLGTGYALQDENNRWSVFNHKGVKIIDYGDKIDRFWYDWSSDSYGNIYEKGDGSGSYEGNKCGLLGQDGKILTPAIYDYVVGGADDAPSLAAWIFDAVLHVFNFFFEILFSHLLCLSDFIIGNFTFLFYKAMCRNH
ncbi:hypothetical protein AGMMS49965_25140 [Bacteroidia bacterium]|nr:hypothetical protein AGMMS49965_25140 [Bacteroidia bacterium]